MSHTTHKQEITTKSKFVTNNEKSNRQIRYYISPLPISALLEQGRWQEETSLEGIYPWIDAKSKTDTNQMSKEVKMVHGNRKETTGWYSL